MNVFRRLVVLGLIALPLVLAAPPSALAADATAEMRTVTIGVPDMH
jgi:hypothetical protein